MGDVAQILGLGTKTTSGTEAAAPAPTLSVIPPPPKKLHSNIYSKQLLKVLSSSNKGDEDSIPLPPIVPAMVKVNNKYIQTSKKCRSWCWAPFSSGARNDGLMLHHWVRAGVEYPEYPFARFNVHLDALNYSEENEDSNTFYRDFLRRDNWTKSETDALLQLCKVHELRWPVIMDRWIGTFGTLSNKKVEDLQHRYYSIGMILNRRLVEKAAKIEAENLAKALAASQGKNIGIGTGNGIDNITDARGRETLRAQHAVASAIATSSSSDVKSMVGNVNANLQPSIAAKNSGTTNQPTFDLETERQRRRILEKIWERSKDDELEEEALRVELKLVETQIRKLKKGGKHIFAAATAAGSVASKIGGGSAAPTPTSSRGPSPVPGTSAAMKSNGSFPILDSQFASTAPIPTPGIPYLQSGRLVNPATGGQMAINKSTIKRMEQVLKELNVNDRPVPTKRVCDVYDHVRKGVLTLLTLQKAMLKKESEVVSRRNKLEKVAGAAIAKEIAAKAEAASAAAAAAAAKEKAAAERAKAKAKSSGTKKSGGTKKTTKKKATGDKSGTKRKSVSKKSTGSKNSTASSTGGTTKSAPAVSSGTTLSTGASSQSSSAADGSGKTSAGAAKPKKRARKS